MQAWQKKEGGKKGGINTPPSNFSLSENCWKVFFFCPKIIVKNDAQFSAEKLPLWGKFKSKIAILTKHPV